LQDTSNYLPTSNIASERIYIYIVRTREHALRHEAQENRVPNTYDSYWARHHSTAGIPTAPGHDTPPQKRQSR
jgi:hypothetical protein